MKKFIIFLSFIFIHSFIIAQSPQGINYQGVARDAAGNALSKQNITVEFKIWQGDPNSGGSIIYSEVYTGVATDTFGLYSLVIGKGTQTSSQSFNQIPWANGNMWVQVYIDPTGGSSPVLIASQQLMSVPYALYAQTAGGGGGGGNISGPPHFISKFNPSGNGIKKTIIYETPDSSTIGINTVNPDTHAVLDLVSAHKGLLLPRMTDAQRTAIVSPPHGLMVFQTNASTFYPQGIWYYDANVPAWLLVAPAQSVWTLAGNALTTPGTHYVGTMDDKDLVFKTGNTLFSPTERMRILSSGNGGNVQFGLSPSQYVFPAAKGNAGDVLQLDPSGATNNLLWKPFTGGSSGPWAHNGGIISEMVNSDTVGIGTGNPHTTLDIFSTNANGALSVIDTVITNSPVIKFKNTNPNNGSTVLDIGTAGGGEGVRSTAISGAALSGVSQSGSALWVQNNSGGSSTIDAANLGGHSAGYFHNNVIGGTAPTLYVTTTDTLGYASVIQGGYGLKTGPLQAGPAPIPPKHPAEVWSSSAGTPVNNIALIGQPGSSIAFGNQTNTDIAVIGYNNVNNIMSFFTNSNTNPSLQITGSNVPTVVIGQRSNLVQGLNIGVNENLSFEDINTHTASIKTNALTNSWVQIVPDTGGSFVIDPTTANGDLFLRYGNHVRRLPAGPAGTVLAVSSSGLPTWTPPAGTTNFAVNAATTAQTFSSGSSNAPVNIGAPVYQNGGASFLGNAFVAPSTGIYHFDAQVTVSNLTALTGGTITFALYDPGANMVLKQSQLTAPPTGSVGSYSQPIIISADMFLSAGQRIEMTLSNTSTGTSYTVNNGGTSTWFNGHKIN